MITQVCITCDVEKDISNYTYASKRCKQCVKEFNARYRDKNINRRQSGEIVTPIDKKCASCGILKPISDFHKCLAAPDGKQYRCKQCTHEKNVSDEGYKYHRLYNTSEISKIKRRLKYRIPEVRAKALEYNHSELHKESRKRYNASTNGKLKSKILNATQKSRVKRREYVKTPAGRLADAKKTHKRRIIKNTVASTLTLKQWVDILKIQKNRCAICGRVFTNEMRPHKDHIIPVVQYGPLTFDNVQAVCKSCNSTKCNKAYTGLIRLGLI